MKNALNIYFLKAKRKKFLFAIPFLLIMASAVFYAFFQKPVYVATASLRLEETYGSEPSDPKILSQAAWSLIDRNSAPVNVDSLKKNLIVRFDQKNIIMEITLKSDRPGQLVGLVNEVARLYLEIVSPKAKERQAELRAKTIARVRTSKNDLEREFGEAQKRLEEQEKKVTEFRSEDEKISTLANSLKTRLSTLEIERSSLLKAYTDIHPEVIRVTAQIAQVKEELQGVQPRPMGKFELERELKDRQAAYLEAKKRWEEIKNKRVEELIPVYRLPAVTSLAKEARLISDPKKQGAAIIIAGFLIACGCGVLAVFLAAFLDTSFLTQDELAAYSGSPIIGMIPSPKRVPAKKLSKLEMHGLILDDEKQGALIEPYRLLYTHINSPSMLGATPGGKTILITSSIRGEGKSLIASNLALVMARGGAKVIVIDCDLWRPSIHRIFAIGKRGPGLTDILAKGASPGSVMMNVTDIILGGVSVDTARKTKGLDKLNILSAGSSMPNASELLRSEKTDLLLQDLRKRFDFIVLDGPPLVASADSVILAPKCDATLLVYQLGKTPRLHVRSAVRHLTMGREAASKRGPVVKGVIMNRCI